MLKFIKMHGTGNNYVYIDLFNQNVKDMDFSDLSKKISDVNYGIGADGLIAICSSEIADCKMIMFNKDGSEGKMCGNGIRCVARYVYENILKRQKLSIETKSGIKSVLIDDEGDSFLVTVDMGEPILNTALIPVLTKEESIIGKEYNFEGTILKINCLSMGNPHTVIFVDDVDKTDVLKIGKLVQEDSIFPMKCNVSFVQVIDDEHIKMRVLEIGSGETMSCGTGACASVVAGVLNGYLKNKTRILVDLLGGRLYVTYRGRIYLEGPAEFICEGYYYD